MNDFQYSWEESVKRKKKSAERQNIMDYSQNNSTSICRDFSSYIENELQFVLSKVRKGQMMNSTTFLTMKNKRSLNDKNRSPIYDSSYLNNFNNQFANGNTTNQVVGPKKWNNDEEYNVYFIERNRTYIKKSDNVISRYKSALVGDMTNRINTYEYFYNYPSLLFTIFIAWFITFCFWACIIASVK